MALGCSSEPQQSAVSLDRVQILVEPAMSSQIRAENVKYTLSEGDTFSILDSGYTKDTKYYKVKYREIDGYVCYNSPFRRVSSRLK